MPGEPAHDGQPLAPGMRVHVHRNPSPGEREAGGDPLGAGLFQELDEPLEQPAFWGMVNPSWRRMRR